MAGATTQRCRCRSTSTSGIHRVGCCRGWARSVSTSRMSTGCSTRAPRSESGSDPAALRRGVLLRALRIVALGLLLHAAAHWLMATREFRPMGVLQRIGLCFGIAGLIAIDTRPRTQWLVFGALLL